MHNEHSGFSNLGLPTSIVQAVTALGYDTPTPIQAQAIPAILKGRDILGKAQTGTGKTAAFALPILALTEAANSSPQVLVLVPTRELAIQVSEAFESFAAGTAGLRVLALYGGQDMGIQLRGLRKGAQIIVGTPGRVQDHLRRGTLSLNGLRFMVLDEADEMLRMGFVAEVNAIFDLTPPDKQVALFSATMPPKLRQIAERTMSNPKTITIKTEPSAVAKTRQRFWMVKRFSKLDALTRILEASDSDGVIVFVKTRHASLSLTEQLIARGFSVGALNGDVAQKQRERTINDLKASKIDILVATDVAARGLDVDRISHVINYDMPNDTESYVHRIGRTGRAGRRGEAILMVSHHERRMLKHMERATGQPIESMALPTAQDVFAQRVRTLKTTIQDALASEDLEVYRTVVEEISQEQDASALDIAAALARVAQTKAPLGHDVKQLEPQVAPSKGEHAPRGKQRTQGSRKKHAGPSKSMEAGFERYRISLGYDHHVMPGPIVATLANAAGISGREIGRINIFDQFSTVDLPQGMSGETVQRMQGAMISGQPMALRPLGNEPLPPKTRAKGRVEA